MENTPALFIISMIIIIMMFAISNTMVEILRISKEQIRISTKMEALQQLIMRTYVDNMKKDDQEQPMSEIKEEENL